MSRCFPYPPPGHEKKPRSDHVDFLIKEKHKEKKQKKKDKKEKEKREGKEKLEQQKDKDRNKDKHREKKDRKERPKDKGKKKSKDGDKDSKRISNKTNDQDHAVDYNEEKLAEDGHTTGILKNSVIADELVWRIRDEETGAANQMGDKLTGEFQRFENMRIQAEKERGVGGEINATVPAQRRMAVASAMEDRGAGNAMPQSAEQRRVDGMGKSTDKDAKKTVEAKEKAKELEGDDKKGGKKDKDRGKKHKKDKDRDKEKAKEEKERKKKEHKHKEQVKSIGIVQRGHVDSQNAGSLLNPQEKGKSADAETSLKRKDINGFLHDKGVRPNKLSKPASSSQLPTENGREFDPTHIATPCASDRHEAVNTMKVEKVLENKKPKINGVIDGVPLCEKLGPPPIAEATGSSETFNKPPHPDEKYLSQILRLPVMEEWPDFDDQEWILKRNNSRQKPKLKQEADEMPQVWDKPLHIDSADVLALPFVIPY